MSKLLLSLLLFLVTVPSGWAQEITGEGVGPTKDQAKRGNAIEVEIVDIEPDEYGHSYCSWLRISEGYLHRSSSHQLATHANRSGISTDAWNHDSI